MFRLGRTIAMGIAGASLATAAAAEDTAAEAATYVVNALQEVVDSMDGRGWVIRQGFIGHVDASSTYTHPIRTDRAQRFQIKGFCDRDCTDMDLALVTSSGQVVLEDNGIDDTPELRFTTADLGGRSVAVRVKMYNCSTDVCYYSVGLFSR